MRIVSTTSFTLLGISGILALVAFLKYNFFLHMEGNTFAFEFRVGSVSAATIPTSGIEMEYWEIS